jgi:hypothetical protein
MPPTAHICGPERYDRTLNDVFAIHGGRNAMMTELWNAALAA